MLEPGILRRTVPMLDLGRNSDDSAGSHRHCLFPPFLIPTTASYANQNLNLLVMNMPVVTAARLKGDIGHPTFHLCQETITREVLSVSGIRFSLRPYRKIYSLDRSIFPAKYRGQSSTEPLRLCGTHFTLQQGRKGS